MPDLDSTGERYQWVPLSGSTNGAPVHLTATGTPGDTVHTAQSGGVDIVWVWANNVHTGDVVVSFEVGGTGVTKQLDMTVVADSAPAVPLIDGWLMANGLTLKAFAGTTAVVNLTGKVKRYD